MQIHKCCHKRESRDSICVCVEYTCDMEHMVNVSESPEARMDNIGKDLLVKSCKFNFLRNPMLISLVFIGLCVKLSPYLENLFVNHSQENTIDLSQGLTLAPYSTRVMTLIAKDADNHLLRKGPSFRLHKNVLDLGIYTYHVYCSHDDSMYPLMLDNPNPNSITIK